MEDGEIIKDRINGTVAKKSGDKERKLVTGPDKIPNLIKYATAKLAVEEARKLLLDKGVSAKIDYDENPLGEEGLWLLSKLEEKIGAYEQLKIQLDAAERNLQNLKERQVDSHPETVPVSAGADK